MYTQLSKFSEILSRCNQPAFRGVKIPRVLDMVLEAVCTGVKILDSKIVIHFIIWYLKSRVPKVLQIVLKLLLRPLQSSQNPHGGLHGGFFGSFHYGKRLLVGVFVGKINTAQLGAKGPILGVVGASSVPILASTWGLHVEPPRGVLYGSTYSE